MKSLQSQPRHPPVQRGASGGSYLAGFVRSHNSPSYSDLRSNIRSSQEESQHEEKQLSRKDSLLEEELRERYASIEHVLNQENRNLKKQANYLANEVRKALKREKDQRAQLKRLEEEARIAQRELERAEGENADLREFVQSKIVVLVSCVKTSGFNQMVVEVKRVVRQLCDYFNISLEMRSLSPPRPLPQQLSPTQRIEDLNDKFQALMYEYKSSSRPELRKQCIDIAKQIKEIKVQKGKDKKEDQGNEESNKRRSNSRQVELFHRLSEQGVTIERGQRFQRPYSMADHADHANSLQNTQQKQSLKLQDEFPRRQTPRRNTLNDRQRHISMARE